MLRRMMRSLVFVVIVGALYASLAAEITGAAEIEECKRYLTGIGRTVDFQKAFQCFESQQSPVAKGYVAYMYFTGRWVKKDMTKGNAIFNTVKARIEAACNKGSGDACFLMGIYASVAKKDYQKEMEWYLKAADKGDAIAMRNIGFLYYLGQGVEQDYQKAMEWFIKAADKGEATAMRNIGFFYTFGQGVKQDDQKAMEWYLKAADKGEASAMAMIGALYADGQGVEQNYQKAMEWYLKAADKGDAIAMGNIGVLYREGKGVQQSYQKAMEWFTKAADKGDASSMMGIGNLFSNGEGVKQDHQKAMQWYLKAADKGDAIAMRNIGILYSNGEGVQQDYQKAMEWYLKAADKGDAGAMNNIGNLYEKGQGLKQDDQKAMEWFTKAADKGDITAMKNMAIHYKNGRGVTKNENMAKEWYAKADALEKPAKDEQVRRIESENKARVDYANQLEIGYLKRGTDMHVTAECFDGSDIKNALVFHYIFMDKSIAYNIAKDSGFKEAVRSLGFDKVHFVAVRSNHPERNSYVYYVHEQKLYRVWGKDEGLYIE